MGIKDMENSQIIGFDINEYEAQLCRYDAESKEPVSVMVTAGGSRAAFPVHLAYLASEGKWKYGIEADYFIRHKNAVPVNYFFRKLMAGEGFRTEGKTFSAENLLAEFISLALTSAGITDPVQQVHTMYITVPRISRELAHTVEGAYRIIGFSSRQAFLQEHSESFFYHSYYQDPDIYRKGTALYYFPDDHTVYYQAIATDNSTRPATVSQKESLSRELPADTERKDEVFSEFIDETLENKEYSGIFLVGSGFSRSWAKNSLVRLCKGRRKVFYGNSLFAKGACYAAMERCMPRQLNDYLFLSRDLVTENMGMDMMIGGEADYKPLITAGIHWYEAEKEIEFLLNHEREIILRTSSMRGGSRKKIRMTLPGLAERPPKTTRIRLTVRYEDAGKCVIRAEDLGFGDFYPATHQIWEETL